MAEHDRLLRALCVGRRSVALLSAAGILTFTAGCGGGGGGSSTGGGGGSSPTITSVSVSCSPASILITQTSTCASNVTGTGNYSSSVTWSVSPASVGSISSAGVFTPAAAGTATITATLTQDSTKSGNGSITAANTTALAISIIDLPTGTAGSVTVTDPNGQITQVTASEILTAIPGSYTVTAVPVVVGTSTYHATQTTQTATVTSGSPTAAVVDYYNIIPNTTKVLDQTGAQSLVVSPDGSTLTISSASVVAQSLKPGDVLASAPVPAAPGGLLVKVVTAATSGSTITVTTTPATLADEITQARFGVDIPFVLASPSGESQREAGAGLLKVAPGRAEIVSLANPCSSAAQELSLSFSYSLPPDPNQNTLTASGELDVCSLHVDFDIRPLSTYASVTANVQQFAEVLVEGQYSASFQWTEPLDLEALENQVVCLGNEPCQNIVGLAESVGNGIAVISPDVTPFVGMQGSAAGGVYLGAEESGPVQAGASVQGAVISPVFSSTLQEQPFPTALDGAGDIKGYFGVTLGLTLLGSATAHVDPRTYAELSADTATNPWWTLSAGEEADAGLTLSFLGFDQHEYDTQEYTIFSAQLAQAPGAYAGQPTLVSLNPASALAGSPATTLALSGSNFAPGCEVEFNGSPLATTYSDPTSLTAVLPASLLANAGSYPVAVDNSDVTGTTSNALSFTVIPQPVSVTVTPASAQIPINGVQQFAATVANTSNTAVTWSVNGLTGGNSTVGTISSAGLYTAPATVPSPATVTVTATSQADTTKSASATVTIGPYTTKTLYSFTSLSDGAAPSAPLIEATDGNLYGTAQVGGTYGDGTVFKADSAGNVTTLHEFSGSDGWGINGSLIQASDGNFYGTTDWGGAYDEGTIFRIDSSGNFTSLYSFTGGDDGGEVLGNLIQAKDGFLYGTTFQGGTSNSGAVFKTDLSGNLSTLYSFTGDTDGYGPAGLIQGTDGFFYGGTQNGGDFSCGAGPGYGCGTIFKIDSEGDLQTLYTFTGGQDGAEIDESLFQANDGYFYGTSVFGGDPSCTVSTYTGCGTIFKIDSSGDFTLLHDFTGGAEGGVPFSSLIQAGDGDFYGTATAGGDPSCSVTASGENYPSYIGCGTVFQMDSAGNVNALYSFKGSPNDGSNPFAAVVEGSDGYLYGTTRWGGTATSCPYTSDGGCGTFFRVAGPGGPLPPTSALKPSNVLPAAMVPAPTAQSKTTAFPASNTTPRSPQQESVPLTGLRRPE